jgi:hypothetical protein
MGECSVGDDSDFDYDSTQVVTPGKYTISDNENVNNGNKKEPDNMLMKKI